MTLDIVYREYTNKVGYLYSFSRHGWVRRLWKTFPRASALSYTKDVYTKYIKAAEERTAYTAFRKTMLYSICCSLREE